ncbi:MAG: hypothetical protein WC866_03770 [Patescibacteria group bacterium]|jgi:hypothetical protein
MKKPFAIIGCAVVIVATYFFGYFSSKEASRIEFAQIDCTPGRAATGSSKLFGKIVKINENSVALRLVEWVEGEDNQEQAALETERCTLERIEKDECVPNNFFLRETQKTLQLPIAANLSVQVLSNGANGEFKQDEQQNTLPREVSLTDLQKMLEIGEFAIYTPFVFTTTNGAITKIQEQYIP